MSNLPLQLPTGLVSDDTVFAAQGRWTNGSLVRFFAGSWEIKGGWERLSLEVIPGVCRSLLGWSDVTNELNIAFGHHAGLHVWRGSLLYNITPEVPGPVVPLGTPTDPLGPFWTPGPGGPNEKLVVVQQAAHGYVGGQRVVIAGATATGGVNINGTQTVSQINGVDQWYFLIPTPGAGGFFGGGAATAQGLRFPPGQIDGTGGAGYGTGAYGVGTYGSPSLSDYFPLTWSLANYGASLLANPRDRPIYLWNGTGVATVLAGAPVRVTYMLVVPQRQVMAFGCNEEIGGAFNPLCIRWSDIEDYNDWATTAANNAGEWILESGGRIVTARNIGDYVLVWTTVSLFLGTFLGDPGQTWKFEKVGEHCGSISPGGPIVSGQNAAWISPDRMFWSYTLGGEATSFVSPIRSMFADHITQGQDDKVVGSSLSTFKELTWFWPDDRDGFEVSRSITMSPEGWSRDIMPRSAFCDTGPMVYPVGVAPDGKAYWHEKGHTADGALLEGFLESSDFYMSEAEGGVLCNGIWPDIKDQVGALNLSIVTRPYPQGVERPHGPWALAPGQNKRSFRVSGRTARLRLDFASAPARARGGKPELDIQPIGGR